MILTSAPQMLKLHMLLTFMYSQPLVNLVGKYDYNHLFLNGFEM